MILDNVACIGCGCTQQYACTELDGRPCSWYQDSPPVCSFCAFLAGVVLGIRPPPPDFDNVPIAAAIR